MRILSVIILSALLGFSTSVAHSQQQGSAASPEALERYVGEYELGPNRIITITREGSRLYAQNTGAPRVEILPAGVAEFTYSTINARLRFSSDAKDNVTQLAFIASGTELVAKRLKPNVETAIDSSLLKHYVGYYEIQQPYMLLHITQGDSKLFAQIIGQPKFQIFAKGDQEFFYKVVPAQIAFAVPEEGRSKTFVLTQGGVNFSAARVTDAEGDRKSKDVLARVAAASKAAATQKKEITVSPDVLQGYVGRYKVDNPQMVVSITLEGGRLYSQTTLGTQSTPKQEIFAESPKHFFYKGVPIEVTFVPDAAGKTQKAVFSSGGEDSIGIRVP